MTAVMRFSGQLGAGEYFKWPCFNRQSAVIERVGSRRFFEHCCDMSYTVFSKRVVHQLAHYCCDQDITWRVGHYCLADCMDYKIGVDRLLRLLLWDCMRKTRSVYLAKHFINQFEYWSFENIVQVEMSCQYGFLQSTLDSPHDMHL